MESTDKKKITTLTIVDVLVVAVILFGLAFFDSTKAYIKLINNVNTLNQNVHFTNMDNYIGFVKQSILLLLAFGYLYWRKFDFRVWKIKFSFKGILLGLLFFVIAGFAMDIYTIAGNIALDVIKTPSPLNEFLMNFNFSRVLYSLLNGFYEEIFFLGVCLSVKTKDLKWVIPLSLIIRFSFHTYQGMLISLGLGFVLGTVFYLLYFFSKKKNLFPFFIAHAMADIIGLSVLSHISKFFS